MTGLQFFAGVVISFFGGMLVSGILVQGKVADLQDEVRKWHLKCMKLEGDIRALIQNQTAGGGSPQSNDNGAQPQP